MFLKVKMSVPQTVEEGTKHNQSNDHSKKKKRTKITPDELHLGKYIRQLQKEYNHEMHLSTGAVSILNDMTELLLKKIINCSESFRRRINKDTLHENEIKNAMLLLLPKSFISGKTNAVMFGEETVRTFLERKKQLKEEKKQLKETKQSTESKQGKKTTASVLASLVFPVSRVKNVIKELNCANRIGKSSSVFMTAILQYLLGFIINESIMYALQLKRKTVNIKSINYAIANNPSLKHLFADTVLVGSVSVQIDVKHKIKKHKKTSLEKKKISEKKKTSEKKKSSEKKKTSEKKSSEKKKTSENGQKSTPRNESTRTKRSTAKSTSIKRTSTRSKN